MHPVSAASRSTSLERIFLCFFFYSVLGWLYEVFLETVVYQWGFTNRGVLFGPYCPVYGFGALIFLFCFRRCMGRDIPMWLRCLRPLRRLFRR